MFCTLTLGKSPLKGGLSSSQVEVKLVQVHVARDRADLRAEAGDLVGQHAGGRNFDRVVPVVVVVAERVSEV